MRHAFDYYGMWRPFAISCGGQPMDKAMLYPSQTSLLPIHRPREMDGLLGWAGIRTRKLESGAHDASAFYDFALYAQRD